MFTVLVFPNIKKKTRVSLSAWGTTEYIYIYTRKDVHVILLSNKANV